jgi:PAS domain S-box-containing protein
VHYGFFITGICLFISIIRYRLVPVSLENVTINILHSISDFVLLSDPDGRIVWSNAAISKVLDFEADELKRMGYSDFTQDSDRTKLAQALTAEGDEEPSVAVIEVAWKTRSGSTIPVSLSITPLRDPSSELQGHLLIGRDLRERIQVEEERSRLHRLEGIQRLAGGVAHSFNNILTPVKAYAEYVAMKLAPDDPLRMHLLRIISSADRASRQAERLLLFSGQYTFVPTPASLEAIVRGAEGQLQEAAHPAMVRIELSRAETTVAVDSTLIEWALEILVRRAGAGSSVGRTVKIRSHAELDAWPAGASAGTPLPQQRSACVSITAEGRWVNIEHDACLFEPYRFGQNFIDTSSDLSVAYGIITMHSGVMKVFSEVGGECTLRIVLPAAVV